MKVDRLSYDAIEGAALSLLAEYKGRYPQAGMLPVPVDDIIECCLDLDFGFTDLVGLFKDPNVLGALWIDERRVRIDQSLDPIENPVTEGRYRYTVAHEAGHWILHRRYFLGRVAQPSLFGTDSPPSIVCRSNQKKEPIEWQADTFASYLLMPRLSVLAAWEEKFGTLNPYCAADEIEELTLKWGTAKGLIPTVTISREMAKIFKVSAQAMQIRLLGLGLIQKQRSTELLFDSLERAS